MTKQGQEQDTSRRALNERLADEGAQFVRDVLGFYPSHFSITDVDHALAGVAVIMVSQDFTAAVKGRLLASLESSPEKNPVRDFDGLRGTLAVCFSALADLHAPAVAEKIQGLEVGEPVEGVKRRIDGHMATLGGYLKEAGALVGSGQSRYRGSRDVADVAASRLKLLALRD